MTIAIDDRLPDATFKIRTGDGPAEVKLSDLTAGKKVILFGVPGAFTPTCHLNHLPGFLEHFETFKAKGVDEIAVISVNDHHVMHEWSKATKGEGKIHYLPDFDAAFTKAIGMDVDLAVAGLGVRSKRYSMLVEDGVVTRLNLESNAGQATNSGAAHMIDQL